MLQEFTNLESRGLEPKRLIRAANALMNRQFLFAGDYGTIGIYETLTDARTQRYFEGLFDALGYRFKRNDQDQWVGLVPDVETVGPGSLKIEETLVLLALALVWQERVNAGEVGGRGVVEASSHEVFDRLSAIVTRKDRMKERRFIDIVTEFKRRGFVQIGERDEESGDVMLEIRPMIREVAGEDILGRIRSFAEAAAAGADLSEDARVVTIAANDAEEAGA